MKNAKLKIVVALSSLILAACGGTQTAKMVAEKSLGTVGCKVSQSEMWNSLHAVAESGGAYPTAEALRAALLEIGANKGMSGNAFEKYVDAFVDNYSVTIEGIKEKFAPSDLESWKKALAEMEIGVRVTEAHAELSDKVEKSLSRLAATENALQAACPINEPPVTEQPIVEDPIPGFTTVWEQLKAEANPEIFGSSKTIATIYQSCDVLKLPPMDAATPELEGIKILAERHPAGGMKRVYGSLSTINNTHYYIHNQHLAKNSCVDIRNAPPIYDFGGKPYTSSSAPQLLDLFKDGGTGTSVRGIDCSAFVFSSLALAGLKMDPNPAKPLKADLVHGIGSRAFKEPQSNGLRCLDKIGFSTVKSIESGDVAAINGHVVMLEDVGADPFGLKRAKTEADCNPNRLTSSGFDFTIAQSSPSKGGVGINRFRAKDYLATSSTYKSGLTAYAVAACRAKFGLAANLSSPNLSVVRHRRTPECKAEPLKAKNEECVDSCQAI